MKRLLFTILLWLYALSAIAQTTTEGTEFWFGYMQNFDEGAGSSLELFITSKVATKGEIFLPVEGTTLTFTVNPGQTYSRVLRFGTDNPFAAFGSGNIELKGIRVTSDDPISVYAFNNRTNSADASVILPTNSLGNEYYAQAYFETPPSADEVGTEASPSQVLIVSPQDDTVIEITPSADLLFSSPAGTTFEITMNAGEVYQMQSQGDLTGTHIRTIDDGSGACKNIAVFGGNKWTRVTGGQDCSGVFAGGQNWAGGYAGDHLYEQMYPVSSWGKSFLATPIELRNNYVYRVIASEDNTIVSVDGITQGQPFEAGEYRDFATNEAVFIQGDRPISVAQFSTSVSCDNNNAIGDGDPWMIIMSPNEQRLTEVTFNALSAQNITNYFLTLIGDQNTIANTTLNGNQINAADITNKVGSGLSYASISLNKGQDYTIQNDDGVIPYVYAYGGIESFGYSAGASLENLNLEILGHDEFIGNIVSEACVDAEIEFDASFETEPGKEPRYDTFLWDFGDGTTATGIITTHVYDVPGDYVVSLLASKGNADCGNSETINKNVKITAVNFSNFSGPASVCPDVVGIAYSIEGDSDNYYEWEVVGGTITSGQGTDEILVDWGEASDFASVNVTPFNYLGCETARQTMDVIINKRLEPARPQASSPRPDEVCFTERNRVRYFTPATNGSEYEWFVEGGSFTADSDPSSNEVFVDWGNASTGKIWYREFNPLISDCEGFSDVVEVTIYPEIQDTGSVVDALCFGDANGKITLDVTGGKNTGYIVLWDNGMTGLSIEGLAAGDYTASIRDALGCEITSQTYTVGEPDRLEFGASPVVQDVRCFQEANGEILLDVRGGTRPYTFNWTGENFSRTINQERITGLRSGSYNVEVVDANGCTISSGDIFVDQPPLLEADLETLINDPVCPQASDGTAFVDAKGGSPDYQFYWSNDPTVDEQEGSNMSKGTYSVLIQDSNGCTTSLTIDKTERDPKVFMPNAFSPNGDGINDEFKAVADCDVTYSLQIFNKWGTIVFSTNDVNEGWDGRFNGEFTPSGKYSYLVFWAATINGVDIEQNIRGTLNIYK